MRNPWAPQNHIIADFFIFISSSDRPKRHKIGGFKGLHRVWMQVYTTAAAKIVVLLIQLDNKTTKTIEQSNTFVNDAETIVEAISVNLLRII